MAAIGKVTEWLQERLGVEDISLNERNSQALLADGVGPEQMTEEQRVAGDTTGLTVVRPKMRIVGVPVGTEQFQRDFLQEAVNVRTGTPKTPVCTRWVEVWKWLSQREEYSKVAI